MNWFLNLSLKVKLVLSFAVVSLIAGIIGVIGVVNLNKLDETGITMYERNTKPLGEIGDAAVSYQRIRVNLRDLVLATDADEIKKYSDKINELEKNMNENLVSFEKTIKSQEVRKEFDDLKKALEAYQPFTKQMIDLAGQNKDQEAISVMRGAAAQSAKDVDENIKALVALKTKLAAELAKEDHALARNAIVLTAVLAVLGVAIALGLGMFVAGLIARPLRSLARQAEQIAEGDLTVNIRQKTTDEVGKLAGSFARMSENLRTTIQQVADTANQVSSAAEHLQGTATQMATGAEEVASQTGTVATASEEMAATSGEIAQNCSSAAQVSGSANDIAMAGSVVVQETINGMQRIAERVQSTALTVEALGQRSDQIGAIIGTIEDIADQTNLLALNAAIEAARAGEQGRGFAVVADEVRALAERTTKATREIGEMIKAIQQETQGAVLSMEEGVQEVAKGSAEAAKSGEALQNILTQIQNVTMQVSQIATAAEEQTATTSEITNNIQQITEVVRETAIGAQQSATAAHQLSGLASELQKLVGQFKLAA